MAAHTSVERSPVVTEPGSATAELSADTVRRLAALAESEGSTLSTALLAVAGVLVHRYVGWDTVVVGAGESASFVSLDLAGDPTFADALSRVAAAKPEAADPGDHGVCLWLQSERQLHSLVSRPSADHGRERSTAAAIRLSMADTGGGVQVVCDGVGIEDDRCLARIVRHFVRLAASAAVAPATRLSRLPLLDVDEYTRIVVEWNATEVALPEATVHGLVAAQAAASPDACALRCGGETVSYRELEARANRLAHHLRERHVRLDVPVAVCLERSIDAIVAILGVLKAGGVYVPVDPEYPPARIGEMLADCAPAVTVTRSAYRGLLQGGAGAVVCLDTDARAIDAAPASAPAIAASPDHAAYILYTSGSAGKPKPLIGTHRSITNGLCDVPFRREADEICCLDSSLSFGFSISRTFLPLFCGHTLVVLPSGRERDLVALVDFWESEGIGNVAMVTPVCRRLLGFGPRLTSKLHRVRMAVVGGALITPDLIASFLEALPHVTLCAGYAASEVGGAIVKKERTAASPSISSSMGRPFPNTRVYVLDPALEPVPVGVAGEVYVAARHLSRGYLAQPSMTATRFVANPFAARPGERLYRTSDLGRYLENGELELLGRVDDMVKVRGFRVELQEIEAVLSAHPDVNATAVAVRDISGESQIVAYVVPREGAAMRTTDLRACLAERLPEYMRPSRFVLIDDLPLTSLGKVDRARLPEVGPERPQLDAHYEAAVDDLEAEIGRLWEALLQVEGIGMEDNFLYLGGDSVFATMLTARLCDRFDIDLSVAVLFECPTVRTLAAYVRPLITTVPEPGAVSHAPSAAIDG